MEILDGQKNTVREQSSSSTGQDDRRRFSWNKLWRKSVWRAPIPFENKTLGVARMNKNILQSLKSTRVFPEGYGKVYCLYNLLLIPRKSLVLKKEKKVRRGKYIRGGFKHQNRCSLLFEVVWKTFSEPEQNRHVSGMSRGVHWSIPTSISNSDEGYRIGTFTGWLDWRTDPPILCG